MTAALPYVTAAETIAAIEKRYNPAEIGALPEPKDPSKDAQCKP
jgi:hypothetical protein